MEDKLSEARIVELQPSGDHPSTSTEFAQTLANALSSSTFANNEDQVKLKHKLRIIFLQLRMTPKMLNWIPTCHLPTRLLRHLKKTEWM